MARVTYGSGITGYRGSIGGITYQKNLSGDIAKLRSNPTVNPTPRQIVYETRLAYLVSYWQALSTANQASWATFATAHQHTTPWGELKTISGYQWFLSCNLRRMMYYSTPYPTAPSWTAYSPPDPFTLSTSAIYINCAWAAPYTCPQDIIAYASLPLKASSLKMRRSLLYLKYELAAGTISILNLATEISALYNVVWADFYNSANCNIIIRLMAGSFTTGLFSSHTSAIIKII